MKCKEYSCQRWEERKKSVRKLMMHGEIAESHMRTVLFMSATKSRERLKARYGLD